jgi:pimeloyl-ACP methyl ester carboxylesterase
MKKNITQFRNQLLVFALAFLAFACQDQNLNELSRNRQNEDVLSGSTDRQNFHHHRKVYVLVHGAWHPESAWDEVKCLLEKSGSIVKTVQLPGLGDDPTPVETVTFQDHVNAVTEVVMNQSQPVILVGHSYAGAVISQVGENVPQKIKELVYISGYMLADGENIAQWAFADTESLVTQNLMVEGAVAFMTPENYGKALYNEALKGNPFMRRQAKKIIAQLRPHPVSTLFEPLHLTSVYRNLDKVYISCLKDKAVTPAAQQSMYSRFPETELYFIRRSDHSPFVTTPFELAAVLKFVN